MKQLKSSNLPPQAVQRLSPQEATEWFNSLPLWVQEWSFLLKAVENMIADDPDWVDQVLEDARPGAGLYSASLMKWLNRHDTVARKQSLLERVKEEYPINKPGDFLLEPDQVVNTLILVGQPRSGR